MSQREAVAAGSGFDKKQRKVPPGADRMKNSSSVRITHVTCMREKCRGISN